MCAQTSSRTGRGTSHSLVKHCTVTILINSHRCLYMNVYSYTHPDVLFLVMSTSRILISIDRISGVHALYSLFTLCGIQYVVHVHNILLYSCTTLTMYSIHVQVYIVHVYMYIHNLRTCVCYVIYLYVWLCIISTGWEDCSTTGSGPVVLQWCTGGN